MTLAERIKHARTQAGFTQITFSEAIGCTQPVVSRYENGKNIPSLARLQTIAEACEVSFEWLATGNGQMAIQTLAS